MPHFAQYPVLTPGESDSYAIRKQRPTDQVAMSGDENARDPHLIEKSHIFAEDL